MLCKKCGTDNSADAKYCKVCGYGLKDILHTPITKKQKIIIIVSSISVLIIAAILLVLTFTVWVNPSIETISDSRLISEPAMLELKEDISKKINDKFIEQDLITVNYNTILAYNYIIKNSDNDNRIEKDIFLTCVCEIIDESTKITKGFDTSSLINISKEELERRIQIFDVLNAPQKFSSLIVNYKVSMLDGKNYATLDSQLLNEIKSEIEKSLITYFN